MYSDTLNPLSTPQMDSMVEPAFDGATEIFAGLQKMVELNVQTVKTSLSEQQALTNATLSARSLNEVIDLQSQQLSATVKKAFAYWRHVEDIAMQTRSEIFLAMHDRFGAYLRTFTGALDGVYGAAAEESLQKVSLLVGEQQSTSVTSGPVSIVDSTGKAVSSDDVRSDLH